MSRPSAGDRRLEPGASKTRSNGHPVLRVLISQEGQGRANSQEARAPQVNAKMAIQELIDRLENIIAQGSRLPVVDKVLVSMPEVLAVLDELRLAVPEEVKEARRVLKERDHLLAEAQKEAARLLADSHAALDARIRDSEMVRRAEERAREVLQKAQAEAQAILEEMESRVNATKSGADKYALEVLRKLDVHLANFQSAVRRGIEVLERENTGVDHGT